MGQLSDLEIAILQASARYRDRLMESEEDGKEEKDRAQYYLSVKHTEGYMTVAIKPRPTIVNNAMTRVFSKRGYPDILHYTDGVARMDDMHNAVNKAYVEFLKKEIPHLKWYQG